MSDPVTLVAAGLLALMAIAAVISAVYLWWIYRGRREEALFLKRLIQRDLRVALSAAVVAVFVIYSLVRFAVPELGLEPIPPPLPSLVIAGALAVAFWGVVDDAITVRRERSHHMHEYRR